MGDFALALPEIFLLLMSSIILIVSLYLKDQQQGVTYLLTQLTLLATAILCAKVPEESVPLAFGQQFIADNLAQILKIAILTLLFIVLLYSRAYVRDRSTDQTLPRGEYHLLVLFSALGMMVLVSAQTLLMVYLGLELMSLPLYALVALRRDNKSCVEAAMKYFIMGALASGMLLYGMSLLFGLTSSLDLTQIAFKLQTLPEEQVIPALFAMVFVIAGLAFKLGLVPFHMWIPDVYEGAPTSVTLLIGTAPKVAAFGMAYRLLVMALPNMSQEWVHLLVGLSVLSLAIGNIVAIAQTNIKRMLAYSTISHIGFLTLAFLTGPQVGYSAALYYILIYALVSACAFGMIIYLSHKGFEAENIADFKGLSKQSPWLAFMMLLVLFSLAGVPPTAGFYAKFLVLTALVDSGFVWLAALAVVFSIIGAFYYLRVIKVMYFDEVDAIVTLRIKPLMGGMDARIMLSLNGLAVLALGLFPGPLLILCRLAVGEW